MKQRTPRAQVAVQNSAGPMAAMTTAILSLAVLWLATLAG